MITDEDVKSIESLHRMKAEGIITEVEFGQAKQRILFGQSKSKPQLINGSTPLAAFTGELPADDNHLAWIILPLRRYADFTGRSARKEFWMFQLLPLGLMVVTAIFVTMLGEDEYGELNGFGALLIGLLLLGLIGLVVPQLALQVRRLHDQDRSGWFAALNLIPYIGAFTMFVLMLLEGSRGDNRFGPDPRAT